MPRVAAGLTLAVALLVVPVRARAGEGTACGARGWPWIWLTWLADGAGPAPFEGTFGAFRARLVAQLGAGLEARHIQLCDAASAEASAAAGASSEVALSVTSTDVVLVAVRDTVTGKRLVREVPLGAVPPDARPLTLALAVDELLRASWIELALPDAPAPARPVAPEIAASARLPPAGAATSRAWELGAGLAAERFGGGTRQAGVDLLVRAAPARPLWLHAALGLRRAADVRAADGVVHATSVGVDVGAEVVLPPTGQRWRLALGASGRLLRASLSGEPRADAHGADAAATAVYLCAGLRGAVRLGRAFGLSLGAGFGVPVRGVDVLDGATRVAGLSGSMLSLALGATWQLP